MAVGFLSPAPFITGLNFISTTTVTNQTTATFDNIFDSTYRTYVVVIRNMYTSSYANDIFMRMRYGATTQSSFTSGGQYSSNVGASSGSGTVSNDGYGNQTALLLTVNGGESTIPVNGILNFQGVGNTSEQPFYSGNLVTGGPAVQSWTSYTSGFVNTSDTYKGFQLFSSSGNIWVTMTLYGMKAS